MKKKLTLALLLGALTSGQVFASWWSCAQAVAAEILASAAVVVACEAAAVTGGLAWAACVEAAIAWDQAVQAVSTECFGAE